MKKRVYPVWRRSMIDRNPIKAIPDIFRLIKFSIQRVRNGYCDADLWSIDYWFEEIMSSMLKEFRETTHGYPYTMETYEEWKKCLSEMIYHLEQQSEGKSDMQDSDDTSDKDAWIARHREVVKYRKENQTKFFEMFGKYFHDLWD